MAISKSEKTAALIIGVLALIVVASVAMSYLGGTSAATSVTTTSNSGASSGTAK